MCSRDNGRRLAFLVRIRRSTQIKDVHHVANELFVGDLVDHLGRHRAGAGKMSREIAKKLNSRTGLEFIAPGNRRPRGAGLADRHGLP